MANQEHLDLLRQGVEVWNAWRARQPPIMPDLEGADLREWDLNNVDLSNADLHGADLRKVKLRGANLRDATLGDAKLSEAELGDANLAPAPRIGGGGLKSSGGQPHHDLDLTMCQGPLISYGFQFGVGPLRPFALRCWRQHPLPARSAMVMGHSRDDFDGLAPLKPQREGELAARSSDESGVSVSSGAVIRWRSIE